MSPFIPCVYGCLTLLLAAFGAGVAAGVLLTWATFASEPEIASDRKPRRRHEDDD
ncbi:MAG: hypothetical protein ACRC33_05325 [Gemmataceae bacterium]